MKCKHSLNLKNLIFSNPNEWIKGKIQNRKTKRKNTGKNKEHNQTQFEWVLFFGPFSHGNEFSNETEYAWAEFPESDIFVLKNTCWKGYLVKLFLWVIPILVAIYFWLVFHMLSNPPTSSGPGKYFKHTTFTRFMRTS